MQTTLMTLLLFFVLISALAASQGLWKLDEFSSVEKTTKEILESCYESDNSSNPILIFGNFHELVDKSSIIRMNSFLKIEDTGPFHFKASKFVVVEDSPKKLQSDLMLMRKTQWWDHMALFFIIGRNEEACENFKEISNITWTMDMINSIYICPGSMHTSVLYTLNLIANYAPHPWERMEELENLNVFRQVFNRNISCKNLNYDKTRFINGYEIKALWPYTAKEDFASAGNDFQKYSSVENPNTKLLQFIMTALNVSGRGEIEIDHGKAFKHCIATKSDITNSCPLQTFRRSSFLFPHVNVVKIAVVRLNPEVSTLRKILKLWSIPVLITAAIALAFLTLILTIINQDFSLAILDLVRLLTYTAIMTHNRNHSFRIYFTTMLIFMVISNGVFQSKIASFLTTREKARTEGTIHELADLGYKMYSIGNHAEYYNEICPKCNFKSASPEECIAYVLNNSLHLCVIWEHEYYRQYSHLSLDYNHKILSSDFAAFGCRQNWPLQNRFSDMILRIHQTGIMDFWKMEQTSGQRHKRQAREAEWSSAQYRPVKLYKLKFAFQTLAIGLLLSTIVFYLELREARYETP